MELSLNLRNKMKRLDKFFENKIIVDEDYAKIKSSDKVIMSSDYTIKTRNTKQKNTPAKSYMNFKPSGLWYSFGTEWIDWVRQNMPDWEAGNLHKIEINYKNVLRLGKDMSQKDFEAKYGLIGFPDTVSGIKWEDVEKDGWQGIEIKHPWGPIGSWIRPWDVSSGCIWDKRAIKKITRY